MNQDEKNAIMGRDDEEPEDDNAYLEAATLNELDELEVILKDIMISFQFIWSRLLYHLCHIGRCIRRFKNFG